MTVTFLQRRFLCTDTGVGGYEPGLTICRKPPRQVSSTCTERPDAGITVPPSYWVWLVAVHLLYYFLFNGARTVWFGMCLANLSLQMCAGAWAVGGKDQKQTFRSSFCLEVAAALASNGTAGPGVDGSVLGMGLRV